MGLDVIHCDDVFTTAAERIKAQEEAGHGKLLVHPELNNTAYATHTAEPYIFELLRRKNSLHCIRLTKPKTASASTQSNTRPSTNTYTLSASGAEALSSSMQRQTLSCTSGPMRLAHSTSRLTEGLLFPRTKQATSSTCSNRRPAARSPPRHSKIS